VVRPTALSRRLRVKESTSDVAHGLWGFRHYSFGGNDFGDNDFGDNDLLHFQYPSFARFQLWRLIRKLAGW
jgi:hypothetical protein